MKFLKKINLSILLSVLALCTPNINGMHRKKSTTKKIIKSSVPIKEIIKSLDYIQKNFDSTKKAFGRLNKTFHKKIAIQKTINNIKGISGIIKKEQNKTIKTLLETIRNGLKHLIKILHNLRTTQKDSLIRKAPKIDQLNTNNIEKNLKNKLEQLKESYRSLMITFSML